jgi:hypothetical protein
MSAASDMLANHFRLFMAIWIGVSLMLILTLGYFGFQIRNHRIPKERPMWEMQGPVFFSDPANFTETGNAYRRKAIWVQVAFVGWLVISTIGALSL